MRKPAPKVSNNGSNGGSTSASAATTADSTRDVVTQPDSGSGVGDGDQAQVDPAEARGSSPNRHSPVIRMTDLERAEEEEEELDPPQNNTGEESPDVNVVDDKQVAEEEEGDSHSKDDEPFEVLGEESKTFYLFARTSREKEEWFNRYFIAGIMINQFKLIIVTMTRLLVGCNFMRDWDIQNPPPSSKEKNNNATADDEKAPETHKAREQRFRIFMETYFQVNVVKPWQMAVCTYM